MKAKKPTIDRNKLFSKLHQLEYDKELIESICDIIQNSKSSDEILTGKLERLNERFIYLQIRRIDKEIIDLYKKLNLIK